MITLPLTRLGRLQLDPALKDFQPGSSGLVATAMVPVPDSPTNRQYAWDVAWADAVRQARELGADSGTAEVLADGSGDALTGGTRVVVAADGEVLLARWLAPGLGSASVSIGPLPRLLDVAAAAARRPAYVVVLADRHGTDIFAHDGGDQLPATQFGADRPGAQHDPHPDRPPAQHHGERHLTDSEPESGGERNAQFVAGRVSQAADSVAAHVVLGAGDKHILDAIESHLPEPLRPITIVEGDRGPGGIDARLGAAVGAALDEITTAAGSAVADRIAGLAEGPDPAAVRGIDAVALQLAEQQVMVLLVADDISSDAGPVYRIGSRPTELLVGDQDAGVEVPLEDGLAWAALHQDAIIVKLPDRTGPLAGEPVAALLRNAARLGERRNRP